ncbi:MAG: glycosyltransferase family 39 protein, partial [Thermoanaerobaculia bacterium]
MASRSTLAAVVAAALLVGAGSALVFDHVRDDSATMDEPFHCYAGAEYVLSGTYYANLEHPPLTKLLAGASLALAGARAPRIPVPFSGRTAEPLRDYCHSAGIPPGDFFAAARRPFLVLFVLLVLVAALGVGLRAGAWAGVAVAAVLSFEPNLIAHAGLVHTDLAAALGFVLTLFLAVHALEQRTLPAWAILGVALGLSLAAKFSTIFLVPLVALLAGIDGLRRWRASKNSAGGDWQPRIILRRLLGPMLGAALALVTLWAAYAIPMRAMSRQDAEHSVRTFVSRAHAPSRTFELLDRLTRVSPELNHYVAGLSRIALQNRIGGGVNVLRGQRSTSGFLSYFPVAFLVKSSASFLALMALALGTALWKRPRLDPLVVAFLGGSLVLVLAAMGSSYNIGVRHILPVYPLLACAAVLVV